jgi:hypothetical protein
MPKRPRQAHVPSQVRRRKSRRDVAAAFESPGVFTPAEPAVPLSRSPVAAVPLGELQAGRRLAEARAGVVRQTGQLPTFEHAYLVRELRQIGITSTVLLGLILILTILLR